MGDPFGLVADESDFLILPSKIANGEGIKYYGDGRFLYHDVMDLNWSAKLNGPIFVSPLITSLLDLPAGPFNASASGKWNSSGNLYDYSTMIGAAFPAGAGRMGVFFNYTGQRGDFSGTQSLAGGPVSDPGFISATSSYNMDSSLDNFNLRMLYGQPLGCDMNIGFEMQIAYVQEQNDFNNHLRSLLVDGVNISSPLGLTIDQKNDFIGELFPFMKPYDSSFWEVLFKAGLEGKFGPASVGMAARGGPIFGGDNSWTNIQTVGVDVPGLISGTARNAFKLDGDVSGFKVGGDLWVRVPYSDTCSLPFSVRIDYQEKTRDGAGIGTASLNGVLFDQSVSEAIDLGWGYKNTTKNLDIEAGGGFDMQVSKDLKVAAGIYYNYISTKERFALSLDPGLTLPLGLGDLIINLDDDQFPDTTKNLVKLKLAAEQKMNDWMLRGGFTAFGGWVEEDYSSFLGTPVLNLTNILSNTGSLDGEIWGVMGSLGASFKFDGYTVEPFVQAGYQSLSVSGPGATGVLGGTLVNVPWSLNRDRDEFLVGAGFSILF
ncbi:MAG: hypothetical protein WAW37_18200 [Syntrophobacteraceae bacterium]